MKKFDPDKELSRVQNNRQNFVNSSKLSNMYVPVLVVACGILSIVGITFSARLVTESTDYYKVHIDIIGGDVGSFDRNVAQGAYSANVPTDGALGEINCSTGNLSFDPLTSTVSSTFINQDTNCIITLSGGSNSIATDQLYSISDGDGISYYYKGDSRNNYIKVNNMLFRIVRVNGDGSLRIILNDVVLSSTYGSSNDYLGSNLESTLIKWYDSNFKNEKYLVDGEFDYLNEIDLELDNLINLEGYIYTKVGTLSAREATIISEGVNNSYLNTINGFFLMNLNGTDNAWAFRNNEVVTVPVKERLSVRPVINIRANIVSGNGTQNDPYIIEED